jgi:SAM-dependent methyltransferase
MDAAARPDARIEPAGPGACYLCHGPALELRFPARTPTAHRDAAAYRCTSFGHRHHESIWRCRGCGLLIQWPRPDDDELTAAYQDVEDPLYVAERDNRYYTFNRVVRRLGPASGRRLLDVGAYCGYFVDVANHHGFAAEGLELSRWAAAQARGLGLTIHNQSLAERAGGGDRYDVVTMWDVVEHLADPGAELAHVRTLLRPGGRLYLSTIDAGSRIARMLGPRWPWLMDMHLYYFDRRTIAALLEQRGFRVVEIGTYTHVVSARYFLEKTGAVFPAGRRAARAVASVTPRRLRIPFNLGDNMLVVAEPAD